RPDVQQQKHGDDTGQLRDGPRQRNDSDNTAQLRDSPRQLYGRRRRQPHKPNMGPPNQTHDLLAPRRPTERPDTAERRPTLAGQNAVPTGTIGC
ncbi:hypothetical protein LSAT2_027564, partial [Lamellibrachia satsuma]